MKKPTFHQGGSYTEYRNHLIAGKKSFIVSQTLRTVKIELPTKCYLFSDSKMTAKEMGLQRQMKDQIEAAEVTFSPQLPDYTCKYYDFATSLHDVESLGGVYHGFENVLELDITRAYYQAALNLGYINKKFYDRCKDLPKPWRLRLVGSIATAKSVFTYEKGVLKTHVKIKDKKGRRAWRNIVDYVDACMNDVKDLIGNDFLFYWVDGIFIKTDQNDKLKLIKLASIAFKRCNFEFDITDIPLLEVVNVDGASQIMIHKEDGIKKPYYISRRNTKAYYFEPDTAAVLNI